MVKRAVKFPDGASWIPVEMVDNEDGSWSFSPLVQDGGAKWITSLGISGARFTSADASAAAASITDAPAAGKHLVVADLIISVDTNMLVDLKEETSGTVLMSLYMTAYVPVQITPRGKFTLPTADKKLQVQTSIAGNIAISAFYYSE